MNPSEHSTAGPAQSVQSVDRALALLAAVAASEQAPTVAELAERCGLNRSTAWRLLATLESHGMVERASASSGYRVGYGAVRLGAAADEASVVRRVRPVLEKLSTHDWRNGEPGAGQDREPAVRRPHLGDRGHLRPVDRGARLAALDVEREDLPRLALWSRARWRAAFDAGAVHREHDRGSGRAWRSSWPKRAGLVTPAVAERTRR